MGFYKGLRVYVNLFFYIAAGAVLMVMAFDVLPYERIGQYVAYMRTDQTVKMGLLIIGAVSMIYALLSSKIMMVKLQREKTIAFDNPDGQVVVSLAAIEDYIRRTIKLMPQVRDIRSSVTANKRGVHVFAVATLFADSNIPETTEKMQSVIKGKLLEMLGIEETINVKIHVAKLVSKGSKEEPALDIKEATRPVPFRGLE